MDRRLFSKSLAVSVISGTGPLLSACGGSGGGDNAPAPTPQSSDADHVTYGAAVPSAQELAQLPRTLSATSSQALPSSADNRGTGYLPPTGDQRNLNSCTAWATGYTSASFYKAAAQGIRPTDAAKQASAADLYAKLLQLEHSPCNVGSRIEHALDILVQNGVASMAESPYLSSQCVSPGSTRDFQIGGWQSIAPTDGTSIKRELAAGRILPFGARVYDEFSYWGFGPNKAGVYRVSQASGNNAHAMTLVGYDDARGAYLVQNSWGSNFGIDGLFWFDYGSFNQTAFQVFAVQGATPSPTPGPTPGPAPAPMPPTPPAPSPQAPVSFSALQPTTYIDYFYGVSVLNIYFTLSEPLFVETAMVVEQGPYGSFTIGPVAINQWAVQSFFQWVVALPQSFPPGQYGLTFVGVTQSGNRVTVAGNRPMALNAEVKRGLAAMNAEQQDLRQFAPRFLRLGDRL